MYGKVKQASLQALLIGSAEQWSLREGGISGEPQPHPNYCQTVTEAALPMWSPFVEEILLVNSNRLPAFPRARRCFPLSSRSRQGF